MFSRVYYGLIVVTLGGILVWLLLFVEGENLAYEALQHATAAAAWSAQQTISNDPEGVAEMKGYSLGSLQTGAATEAALSAFQAETSAMNLSGAGLSQITLNVQVQSGIAEVTVTANYTSPMIPKTIQSALNPENHVLGSFPMTVYVNGN
ncbi:hypothetical protein [Alicyclobacillus tolerans]|uniref:Uncharacterized protein n=1 Tax=Alicyclobacillus tolerans TaxID=90970 RepID=A0A1M6Y9D1_9BACL|nr:hypothetical protein [Alicyclobacillus montanus]SHL14549.1 hypothetical protein SAMN05443507_1452 [Alicyclobacillus montanus]